MADKEGREASDAGRRANRQSRETAEPGTSSSDDTSRRVTGSSDAESSSSSSGVELRSYAAEGFISSSTDVEHEVSSAGPETTGSSPDAGTRSESSTDATVPSGSSSSGPEALQPGSSPADHEISSAGQETPELSPDTGVPSESSSGHETQPGSSPADAGQSAVQEAAEASPDAGIRSGTSSVPGASPEHQLSPAGMQRESSSGSEVLKPDSTQGAVGVISSSTDVGRKLPLKKGTGLGVSNPLLAAMLPPKEGTVLGASNPMLTKMLGKQPIPATRAPPPPPPPPRATPMEFNEADAEEMRAFDPNRFRQNSPPQQRRRPMPAVPRSTSFEEAIREASVYTDEGDHVVPDVGVCWSRTPPGSCNPYHHHHDETTSDSVASEPYTASESYSPEVMSAEEFTADDESTRDSEVEEILAADIESAIQASVAHTHAVVPTLQAPSVDVPSVSDSAAIVPTIPAESVATTPPPIAAVQETVGSPEGTSSRGRATKRHKAPPGEGSPGSDDPELHSPTKKMMGGPRDHPKPPPEGQL